MTQLWQLDDFKGPRMLGLVRSLPPPQAFIGNRWLPDVTTFDIAWEYIVGANKRPIMAHVMGYDSEAPIAGRLPLGTKVQGELPKIARKTKIGEKELMRFYQPRFQTPDKDEAIAAVYGLTAELVQSVLARAEWLRLQALSEDTITYDEGGVTFAVDYGLNDAFQIDLTSQQDGAGNSVSSDVSTVWSDTAASDPVADLLYLCDTIEDATGVRPVEFVCARKGLNYILRNENVRKQIRGSATIDTTPVTRAQVDMLFNERDLPSITTYDVKVRKEADSGTITEVRPLAENKAFLVPGGDAVLPGHSSLGAMLWGPTAESRILLGTSLQNQAPGIIAQTYGTEDPPAEWIKVAATAFPAMPGSDKLGQMTLFSA